MTASPVVSWTPFYLQLWDLTGAAGIVVSSGAERTHMGLVLFCGDVPLCILQAAPLAPLWCVCVAVLKPPSASVYTRLLL
eukprot:9504046-Pyramimonas_sp.AAC.2